MNNETKFSAEGGQTKFSAEGGQTKFSTHPDEVGTPPEAENGVLAEQAEKGGKIMNISKQERSKPGRRRFLKRALMAGAAMALPGITGCDSILAEDPRGRLAPSNFFKSPAEAKQAVFGIYNHLFGNTAFRKEGFRYMGSYGTDLFHGPTRPLTRFIYHYYTMSATNTKGLVEKWQKYYRAVGDANLAISRISKMKTIDPEFQAQLVGEAKFLRALFYYYLTNIWGGVPMWLDELAIEEVRDLPRTPVDEVRAQILEDLHDAEQVLPSMYDSSGTGRATKWAAKVLLAKTYLQMKNWKNARDKAKEITVTSPHRLLDDYGAIFDLDHEFNAEVIFAVNFVEDIKGTPMGYQHTPRQQDEPQIPGITMKGYGHYTLCPKFANSYAEDDLRKSVNVISSLEGIDLNWTYLGKFWDVYRPLPTRGRNAIVFRLADVNLMLAEAENEVNGPTSLAYEGINAVRTRAGLESLSGLTQGRFRIALQQERAWELVGEGHRRWSLIRWGKLVEAVRSAADCNPQGAANIQSHHVLFPIPPREINKNPNLTQNPGY